MAQTQCIGDETLGAACLGGTITDTTPELLLNGTINDSRIHHSRIIASSATLVPGADLYIDPTSNGSGSQELIAYNTYDNLGLLKSKKVGGIASVANGTVGAVGLQTVSYDYNVRGWLTAINDVNSTAKLFNFKIGYNKPENGAAPLYNGNISETQWRTASTDSSLKAYTYGYDPLNRIVGAAGAGAMSKFDLSGIAYDKNGNLLSLTRMGPKSSAPVLNDSDDSDYGSMDILDYAYHDNELSNRLYKVRDDGEDAFGFKDSATDVQDYWYDQNGNMTRDLNKGIGTTSTHGITYNYLNLPTEVVIENAPDLGTISYIYDATGVKLRKNVLTNGNTTPTDYAGNYIYENGNLKQISQPEGYIEADGTGWQYVYYLKDHQRNVRITFADDNGNGNIETGSSYSEIRREQNYYPFGLEHKGYNNVMNGAKNNLKTYQDQEFTEDLGLNTHEWKYRVSDPAIGRFWQIDPLAVEYSYQSPYNFSENRVVDAVELEGLEKVSVHILGRLTTNSGSQNILGTAQADLGNNNRLDFALAIEGKNTINGSYSDDEGFSLSVTENDPVGNARLAKSITDPDGIPLPDFIVQIGIENKKEEINPATIEEALALTPEEVESNQLTNFVLNGLSELIENGTLEGFLSEDGTFRTTKDENGNTRLSQFTTVYSYKGDEFEFAKDGVYFNGQILLQYTDEEIIDNEN